MFAVIKTGGKQFTIKIGNIFNTEKIVASVGDTYKLEDVLLISDGATPTIGSPFIKGASVDLEILEHGKGDKVMIFKKKRRKDYRKRQGHRQLYTKVKVVAINS